MRCGSFLGYNLDMESEKQPPDPFRAFVAKIMQTPKAVVDEREKAYQKERKKHPKRGPKTQK